MAKSKYYVVWRGHETGIFTDWATCSQKVKGVAGAKYKSFKTRAEAEEAFRSGPATGQSKSDNDSGKKRTASRNTVKTWSADEIAELDSDTFIYTDGGCEPNPGEAGSGVAIYRDGQIDELWFGLYNPNGTNNTAELNALHQALLIAKSEIAAKRSVTILCDSKYSIQSVTQWAAGWEKKGWTRRSGEIKNLDLIKDLHSEYQSIKDQVAVLHVNGHVGVEGNELADRMSILAIQEHNEQFVRYSSAIDIDKILAMRAG